LNLILIEPNEFLNSDLVKIQGRKSNHIFKVLKPKLGDLLRVGIINGKLGSAEVVEINEGSIVLRFTKMYSPPKTPHISVVLALPRPKVFSRVLYSLTVLGVKRIAIINCWKVEKCYWQSHHLNELNIKKTIHLALEQSVDTQEPEVSFFRLFKPFVEDSLESWCGDSDRIICHPGEETEKEFKNTKSDIVLVIGPEGGFTSYEVSEFKKRDFKGYSMSPRIMNVETAAISLVSRWENLMKQDNKHVK
jgi:16S rRNA (uracil1498-N3)-methyltransferase